MTLIERITQELDNKCIMHKTFCNEIGVSPSTFSNWIKRNSDPPAKYLRHICSYFEWDYADVINTISNLETDLKIEVQSNNCESSSYQTRNVNSRAKRDNTTDQLVEYFNSLSLVSKAKVMSYMAELKDSESK